MYDHRQFLFASTAELTPLSGIVGQHRAIKAIELGAEILSRSFNIFVMSLLGTGRLITIQSVLRRVTTRHRPLVDYAYMHNFKHSDMPRLLRFEAGGGTAFARAMKANIRQKLQASDRRRAGAFVREIFADERRTFTNPEVLEYLEECEADLLDNLESFTVLPSDIPQQQLLPSGISVSDKLLHYTVNVVLDNADITEPPVLIENHPSYVNLFGTIEKKVDKHGYVKTDFTQIKAGALLRADGGYLNVNAADLLHDDAVWQNLKRLLLYGRLEIQAPDAGLLSHSALKPKHIDSTVKVIMLGDYDT